MSKPQGKAELRRQYLLEKYVWKWKQFMRSRKGEGLFPRLLKLSHNNWLRQVRRKKSVLLQVLIYTLLVVCGSLINIFWIRSQWSLNTYLLQVLFTPATQAARQAACTIVEALTTIPSRKQQVLDLLTRYDPQTDNQQVQQTSCFAILGIHKLLLDYYKISWVL